MKKWICLIALLGFVNEYANAQSFYEETPEATKWVNKQFKKLSKEQKIAQLMIIRAHSNLGEDHISKVTETIRKYNVGGLCFFQGGPVRQAVLTNKYQAIAKTPLMISIDAEWGLGMRLDSVTNFPRQLMMGAVNNAALIYEFGKVVGEQCKRMGIHVNYAPDIDINNNPMNPVINDRSFGEDKYKVALLGTSYMRGMQDQGIMATGKHFPGHGDVAVDSHYDLPVINKSRAQLDALELYPFKALIDAGLGSMMTAHLYIPSIDSTPNLAATLSPKSITKLLKEELGFKGLSFTDALEMKGITKYFPSGEASVAALIAGNDMLCLPDDIPGTITKIKTAIDSGRLSWESIDARVKKILLAKYHLGLNKLKPIDTLNLVNDLNVLTNPLRIKITEQAITLLKKDNQQIFPLKKGQRIAYIAIGASGENAITKQLKNNFQASIFMFGTKATIGKQLMDDTNANIIPAEKADSNSANILINNIKAGGYDLIIVGMHNYSRRPAKNFAISNASVYLLKTLQSYNTLTLYFGNPYAISNTSDAANLMACYEDDEITQEVTYDILIGRQQPKGVLPVTVSPGLTYGNSMVYNSYFPKVQAWEVGLDANKLNKIDSIANDAVEKGAVPGCVVLVARKGKLAYHKAFGFTDLSKQEPVNTSMIYDLASVTKVSATTVAIMKLLDEGKIDLEKPLGDYLPWTKNTDKANLKLKDILLHQAGLKSFITFYKELIDSITQKPLPAYFRAQSMPGFTVRVAEKLYLRNDWQDSIYQRIISSALTESGKYIYSDNDFIFLAKVVESVTGKNIHDYTKEVFYQRLNMTTTGFTPRSYFPINAMVPTEDEKHFRQQMMRGDVHDEGAALFGGIAGHAGLFSNAYDLAQLYQMLLNGGTLNGQSFIKKETIQQFTAYNSPNSRRGLGFDKPEKDNMSRKEPYPSRFVSPNTYGHTGFTGTCVWVDPDQELIYIFLSNRVTPTRNNTLFGKMNVRPNIQEAIYQAILN